MRVLSLLALALVGIAHAALAPFAKQSQGPEYAPVSLRGYLPRGPESSSLPGDGPTWLVCDRQRWESMARGLGLADAPPVNFKTHFVLVHVSGGYREPTCELGGDGSLSVCEPAEDGPAQLKCRSGRSGPRYLARSFPRSAVKTVNGSPLPR